MFGGSIAERFGGKLPLLLTIFLTSLLTLITPYLAEIHWGLVCAKQIAEGAATGIMFSCVHNLLAKWIHPIERNTLASVTLAGPYIGVIFSTSINGLIATSPLGWPGIFYVSGVFGIVWSMLWLRYGSDSPKTHKKINTEEKRFLEGIPGKATNTKLVTPWKSIWCTKSVWAYIIAQCGHNWGFVLVLTSTPTYFDGVHQVDLKAVSICFERKIDPISNSVVYKIVL